MYIVFYVSSGESRTTKVLAASIEALRAEPGTSVLQRSFPAKRGLDWILQR